MAISKTPNQIIVDAVTSLVVAMLENTQTKIEFENSIIGLSPATIFQNESNGHLAWICVHPGMLCPQVFLAKHEECELINAPSNGFNEDDGPQILSPLFQSENKEDGVHGYNLSHTSFSNAVVDASKTIVRWLIEGIR